MTEQCHVQCLQHCPGLAELGDGAVVGLTSLQVLALSCLSLS